MPEKKIICADSLKWMSSASERGSVVTSLPDPEEMHWSIDHWLRWFGEAAALAMKFADPAGVSIFLQTDRKAKGRTISKADLLFRAAEQAGVSLLWHKIVLRKSPGAIDYYRVGFCHLIAFTQAAKIGTASADVLQPGERIYENAMGLAVAQFAVAYAGERAPLIIDPFCGRGTVPAAAQALGFDSIGIDISAEQCAASNALSLTLAGGMLGKGAEPRALALKPFEKIL